MLNVVQCAVPPEIPVYRDISHERRWKGSTMMMWPSTVGSGYIVESMGMRASLLSSSSWSQVSKMRVLLAKSCGMLSELTTQIGGTKLFEKRIFVASPRIVSRTAPLSG
jgi:hypothetical protein